MARDSGCDGSSEERFVVAVEFAQVGGGPGRNAQGRAEQSFEGVKPENLAVEDVSEVARDGFSYPVEADGGSGFLLEGRDRLRDQAAGNDEVEKAEVGIDVECEAVGGHCARDMDTDSGDFGGLSVCGGRGRPDARELGNARSRDAEVGAGADERFFHSANELNGAEGFAFAFRGGEGAKVEDGVANELAGSMNRHIASAVAFNHFDAALDEEFGRDKDVGGFRVAAEGDDRRVFEQEKNITDLIQLTELDELLLQFERSGVVLGAELEDGDHGVQASPAATTAAGRAIQTIRR
jgi:hypothetical protein